MRGNCTQIARFERAIQAPPARPPGLGPRCGWFGRDAGHPVNRRATASKPYARDRLRPGDDRGRTPHEFDRSPAAFGLVLSYLIKRDAAINQNPPRDVNRPNMDGRKRQPAASSRPCSALRTPKQSDKKQRPQKILAMLVGALVHASHFLTTRQDNPPRRIQIAFALGVAGCIRLTCAVNAGLLGVPREGVRASRKLWICR